jgi:hypothetical protein
MACSEWVASKRACHNMATCSKCQQRCWPFQSEWVTCTFMWAPCMRWASCWDHHGGALWWHGRIRPQRWAKVWFPSSSCRVGHGLLGFRWKASMACPKINIGLAPQNNLRSQGGIGCYTLKPYWGNLGIVLGWPLKLPHFFFPWDNISVVPRTT